MIDLIVSQFPDSSSIEPPNESQRDSGRIVAAGQHTTSMAGAAVEQPFADRKPSASGC